MFKFPYTDFHSLNTDWIIKKINEFAKSFPTKVSQLINDMGYLTEQTVPVKSVNNKIGDVDLDYQDVGAASAEGFTNLQEDVSGIQEDLSGTITASGHPAAFDTTQPDGAFSEFSISFSYPEAVAEAVLWSSRKDNIINMFQPFAFSTNGIDFTPTADKSIHIAGTTRSQTWTYASSDFISLKDFNLNVQDTISIYSTLRFAVEWYPATGNTRISYTQSTGNIVTGTVPANATRCKFLVYATRNLPAAGAVIDDTVQCLFAKGAVSTIVRPADKYKISFPSEAGSVNSGVLDLIAKTLTVGSDVYALDMVPMITANSGHNSFILNTDNAEINITYLVGIAGQISFLEATRPLVRIGSDAPTMATLGPGEIYVQISTAGNHLYINTGTAVIQII